MRVANAFGIAVEELFEGEVKQRPARNPSIQLGSVERPGGQNISRLTGDLFRLRFRRKVRIIHEVVSYLFKEPPVNT